MARRRDGVDPPGPPPPGRFRGRKRLPAVPPPPAMPEIDVPAAPPPPRLVPALPPPPGEFAAGPAAAALRDLAAEKARRRCEALRIFEGTPEQERFLASDADERLAIGGNRSGKTTPVMVEIARAVTGADPHDKYRKTDGIFILVALDLGQCARVFYRKLFMAGAFQMIRDVATGRWRPFRPDEPADAARADEAKPAPPLIPPRMVKVISWENKKERVPRSVQLKSGWEIWFFSSAGELPQGVDVDGVAFDEEIVGSEWYPEMAARLLDRRKQSRVTGKVRGGKFLWSATPQAGTVQLYELYSRALEEEAEAIEAMARGEPPDPPAIAVFTFGIDDNPFVDEASKRVLKKKYINNEQEYDVRIGGKFALLGMRVYPEFTPRGVHGIPVADPPPDWTRYCAIDPGRQVCAVLFAAVPPPSHPFGGRVVVYDELYIRRCDAALFARRFRLKVSDSAIEAAIIDMRAGRQREIGSGRSIADQYRDALKAEGVRFAGGEHLTFWWSTASGNDDVKAGVMAVHGALHVDQEGLSRFLFQAERLPFLVGEVEKYVNRKHPSGVVLDEPLQLNNHLCDCLRYLCMARLKYVKPRARKHAPGYTTKLLEQKRARARARSGGDGVELY